MYDIWKERRLEIITLAIFALLVFTSLLILYTSYSNYIHLGLSIADVKQAYEYKVIMVIASLILFLSLWIVYTKRDYFFMETKDNTHALEHLLEEIKFSSDPIKIREFKQMLREKNHTEIYTLISKMINELQASKKLADEANKTKTLFLSNMSHEIRTPINGIVGFANFLDSTKLDSEQADFVHTIRKSSEDLLGVVNNILDISKIESGRVEIEENYFNIIEAFETTMETYGLDASQKEIDFSVWMDPEFVGLLVKSDAEKIKQILINLISNALKFTNRGGKVDVSIEKIRSSDKRITVKFKVEDTGIGISKEHQEDVFNAFTQADNSSTRAYGGTGLGLSIATGLLERLGTTLKLQSQENKGTIFSFSLEMLQQPRLKEETIKPMNVGVYLPKEVQGKKSSKYLEQYLSSFKEISIQVFKTFVECKDAQANASFDVLYIYDDEMNISELKRLVAQYGADVQIVLLTKLGHRATILDIAPIFSQIIYEPVTFSKIEHSLNGVSHHKKERPLKSKENVFELKALVVEDNAMNQEMIVRILKSMGIDSDTADNGQIGVEKFMKSRYDMVFMDIQMPVMNGVAATKGMLEYEALNHLDHTPIVAVTTNALKGDRERYLKAGMDEYIPKPIDTHKFVTVIKQFYATKEPMTQSITIVKKDILLYKQIPTEAKIIAMILTRLGYGVDVAKNMMEFHTMMQEHSYKIFILDKSQSEVLNKMVLGEVNEQKTPTLIFTDNEFKSNVQESFIHLIKKSSDFADIKERVERMMAL